MVSIAVKALPTLYRIIFAERLTKPRLNDGRKKASVKRFFHTRFMKSEEDKAARNLIRAKESVAEAVRIIGNRYEKALPASPTEEVDGLGRAEATQNDNSSILLNNVTYVLFEQGQNSTQLCKQSLNNLLDKAKGFALDYFHTNDYTHKKLRLEALLLAFYCTVSLNFLINDSLDNGLDVDEWMEKISKDNGLRKALKAELKTKLPTTSLQEAYRQNKNFVETINLGQKVVDFIGVALSFSGKGPGEISVPKNLLKYRKLLLQELSENALRKELDLGFELFAEHLRKLYEKKFKTYCPFYFLPDTPYKFDMDNSWVPLTLQGMEVEEKTDVTELMIYDAVLDWALNENKLTIITGGPFTGKTTLVEKIGYDWGTKRRFEDYDFVFIVYLRSAPERPGTFDTILDLTLDYLRDFSGLDVDFLKRAAMKLKEKKVLILLDGYDEARAELCTQLDDLLQPTEVEKNQPFQLDFHLLVTRRPSKSLRREGGASFLKIAGLDREVLRKNYVMKHFRKLPLSETEKDQRVKSVVQNIEQPYSVLKEIAKSPLIITFICLVNQELNEDVNGLPELFDAVIRCIVGRWARKSSDLHRLFDDREEPISYQRRARAPSYNVKDWRMNKKFRELGKRAFLFLRDDTYTFEDADFVDSVLFSEIGLLYQESQQDRLRPCSRFQFVHRAFQEFLAALHVIYWAEEGAELCLKQSREGWISVDFVQMIVDVIMAERPSPFENRTFCTLLANLPTVLTVGFRFQRPEPASILKDCNYLKDILPRCKSVTHVEIDGGGAPVEFHLELPLPDKNSSPGQSRSLNIKHCDFVRGSGEEDCPAVTVIGWSGDERDYVNFYNCHFDYQRLRDMAKWLDEIGDGSARPMRLIIGISAKTVQRLSSVQAEAENFNHWNGRIKIVFYRDRDYEETFKFAILRLISLFSGLKVLELTTSWCKIAYAIPIIPNLRPMLPNLTDLQLGDAIKMSD